MYFTEEDIADRLLFGCKRFFSSKRFWKNELEAKLIGNEGEFGCLKFIFIDNGEIEDVYLMKVFIKDRPKMEAVVASAVENISKDFQNIQGVSYEV